MKLPNILAGIFPIILLGVLIGIFLAFGPIGLLKTGFPPVESISFEKVTLEQDVIIIEIINDGPDSVTISQVLVNDAYNLFKTDKQTLNHLERTTIRIDYPWAEGLPLVISVLTDDGLKFEKDIPIATKTPELNLSYLTTFAILGMYVGVMPVFLGLLWLPFLRTLSRRWYDFFLSFTVGLLVFLAIDAFKEAIGLTSQVALVFQGVAVLAIGFFLTLFTLTAISERASIDVTKKGVTEHALRLSYMIALGIGVHNLGEGLAIGSAYSIGEIALGSLLVIGFMMHNLTEGIAIVAPIARQQESQIKHLIQLGLLAGAPTIIGAWIGAFAFSNLAALFFLAVGAGAILHVVVEITKHMKKEDGAIIFTFTNVLGFVVGLLVMYLTGLFVA